MEETDSHPEIEQLRTEVTRLQQRCASLENVNYSEYDSCRSSTLDIPQAFRVPDARVSQSTVSPAENSEYHDAPSDVGTQVDAIPVSTVDLIVVDRREPVKVEGQRKAEEVFPDVEQSMSPTATDQSSSQTLDQGRNMVALEPTVRDYGLSQTEKLPRKKQPHAEMKVGVQHGYINERLPRKRENEEREVETLPPQKRYPRKTESKVETARTKMTQGAEKSKKPENTLSNPSSSNAPYQTNKQYSLSRDTCLQESKFKAESDEDAVSPTGVDKHVPGATPPETAVERNMDEDIDTETQERSVPHMFRSQDTKVTEPVVMEREEVEKLRRDLSDARSQIAELQKRCEAQLRDLENSNNILNTADKTSDLDIILALQRLNAEVQQNTTYMADCMMGDFEFENTTASPIEGQNSAVQSVSDQLGQTLAKSLGTKKSEDISMLLQIAFQARLASTLCQTASSWSFEPEHNSFIDGIYQRLRRREAQAICGHWRSLARVNTARTWRTHPESLVNAIITDISNVMLAAGCTAAQADIISKVTSKFQEKIFLLAGLAGRLNRMFDDVISSDFEVFAVRPGEKFDTQKMEDADDEKARIEVGSVLCTTHLGLIKQRPVGTLWDKGKKQRVIILKAKVLLESFLVVEDQ